MNQGNTYTQQQQQQLQLKSRQVASASNNPSANNNQANGVAAQVQQNSQSKLSAGKPTHKKSQSTASATMMYMQNQQMMPSTNYSYQQQQQSHNSTPKGSNSQQVQNAIKKQQQHMAPQQQYQVMQNMPVPTQKYSQQGQPFDNRKRSTEVNIVGSGMVYSIPTQQQQLIYSQQQQQVYNNGSHQAMLIQSKSTKVSPQRHSKQVVNLPITQKLGNAFEGVQQKQLNSMDTTGAVRGGEHPHPNISASHMNTYQYFNFDMDGIPQNLISQTTGVPKPQKKDIMGSRGSMPGVILPNNLIPQGSGVNSATEDMNMDSSMHQSFINLIYPSKSKKLMSNEAAVNASYPNNGSQTLIIPQQQSQPGHHKSKSLYVGASSNVAPPSQNHIVQNFVKPVAHQLAPKGAVSNNSQKTTFKKQQNIFTYSQRFKELLNDTMGEEQQQLQKSVGPSSHQQNPFTHQHSPSQLQNQFINIPQNHIMVNFGDIQLKQRSVMISHPEAHQKGTFDNKPLTSHTHNANNQYLTIHDNQMVPNASANKTIDYTQPTSMVANSQSYGKSNQHHNTPNNSHPGKGIQQKAKMTQDPPPPSKNSASSALHQRKPSHPVTNNYMLELLQGQQTLQQNPLLQSMGVGGNLSSQFSEKMPAAREKKQHQPTQSKKSSSTNGSASNNQQQQHQRSVSDYIHQHYQNEQQQNKLLKFLNAAENSDQYDQMMIESFEGNMENASAQPQTSALDSYRGSGPQPHLSAALQNFMQQDFSQMLYDGGNNSSSAQQLSHRQSYPEPPSAATKQTYIILNQGSNSLTQEGGGGGASSKSSNYHFRKMSVQQQPSTSASSQQLNARKSPSKQSKILIHSSNSNTIDNTTNYQKIAQKRRSSPHGSSGVTENGLLLQQSNNFINSQAAHNKSLQAATTQQKQQQPPSQKYPQTAGPSMRSSQVSSPQNKVINNKQSIVSHHHSSSATAIHNNNVLNMQQQQVQVQQQLQPQMIHHNRSNSDLMKQQILNAQAAALKKPPGQQQRPNPAINTTPMGVGQKAKSEMTTPRQAAQQTAAKKKAAIVVQQQQMQQPTNVSIDLVATKSKQQQLLQQNLSKNGSANNLQQQQHPLKRKDSYTKDSQQPSNNTPRLLKNSPQMKAQTSKSSSSHHQHPTQQNVAPSGVGKQRYSMQNSPRQIAQQQQQYNLNQQYQMFQQVMAKQGGKAPQSQQHYQQNKTETVSPNNAKSASFIQPNNPMMRASIGQQQPAPQVLNQSKSGHLDENAEGGGHRRGASETEYLLNQIRNNINTLKAYQPYQPPNVGPIIENHNSFLEQPKMIKQVTKEEKKQVFAPEDKYPKYKRDNLQLPAEVMIKTVPSDQNLHQEQLSYQPLATDPNMSPYSKDLNKLQKLIKFNFRKFQDPPATTSEFYRIGRVLGRGAFGKVNLAAHKISEQLVAIKSINKEFLRSSKHNKEGAAAAVIPEGGEHPEKKKVMQEFAILKQSNHQSVVRLYDTFETTKHICFVMELCAGGDLLTYVRKRRKLTEEVAKYFFKQLIEGLAYLHHSKLIVHRDIKLDNILLDANGKIKIADFGVSRQVFSDTERMSEQCGTPAYIAPEILKDKGYEGFKVDVWSAGVCLYAMLIGTVPFKASSMQELHHLIINGKYDVNNPNAYNQTQNKDGQAASATTQPQQQTKLSEHAVNLIHSILQVDPRKRLSAVEVLSHPWLKDSKDELDVFTQKEKDVIHKEYLAKNIDRIYSQIASKQKEVSKDLNGTGMLMFHDTEVIFTEHNLDTKTNVGSLLKNASTKSIILAPFNSTVSEIAAVDEEGKEKPYVWPEEVRRLIVPKKVLKFAPKVKDLDRQYEHNNNADLDNGVYNNVGNEDENNPLNASNDPSSASSNDSLKRSFKETELSSDDERAELQLDEARKRQKMQQETELQEFEKQIKLKYVRYQEPVEIIDAELVSQMSHLGVYPRDYIMKTLQMKEMNYATACYHLLLKKQQFLAKQQQQILQMQEEIDAFKPNQQQMKGNTQQIMMGMMSGGEDTATGPVKMSPMY